ncbi:MAG TPA: hypothetical protein VMB73_28185, partial [Acetobacteraceae bacterium]|nr:hypothetical protein [Acetobacteraceae bacterium]
SGSMAGETQLSDVGIDIGPFGLLFFALASGWPGILFGGVSGALLWRAHRVLGMLAGGLFGWAIGIGLFVVWGNSTLSRNLDYWDAVTWMALIWFVPGWCAGATVGAASWRRRRVTGIVGGGLIGALAGVLGWALVALSG